jgi:hypothetical protein
VIVARIRDLYHKDKLSTHEVAEKLGISQWRVISLMRRKNIPRRTSSESNHILFLRKPLSYNKKEKLPLSEKFLHKAALMLYWAEGSKKGKHSVDLANSDEKLILVFLKALRRIYRVDEKKLRVFLYCYANQSAVKLTRYWSRLLQIPKSQFIKPYIRRDFREEKRDVMPNGLVHIRYCDKRLLEQIKSEIDIIYSELNRLG